MRFGQDDAGDVDRQSSVARLVTAVIVEGHDEWAVAERRYLSEESMAKLFTPTSTESLIKETPLGITA